MTHSTSNQTPDTALHSATMKRKTSLPDSDGVSSPKVQKKKNTSETTASMSSGNCTGLSTDPEPVTIVESCTPLTSWYDPNEYRVIKLSNGLRALLISRKKTGFLRAFIDIFKTPHVCENPMTEDYLNGVSPGLAHHQVPDRHGSGLWNWFPFRGSKSKPASKTNIAIAVNVGGLDDPKDCQGLAHLTEHVVHCGSIRYPREDQHLEVVWHFGYGNAFTSETTTVYHNNVSDLVLDQNLDMLSEMLSNPSMELDLIKREVHAVDNEFYLNQHFNRKHFLRAHLEYDTLHPLHSLWHGNLRSLGLGANRPGDAVHVQHRMQEMQRNNYVASEMTLTISSTKSLQELQELILKHFSKLRPGDSLKESREEPAFELKLPKLGRHIYLQGISSTAELTLVWHLPLSLFPSGSNEKTLEIIQLLLSSSMTGGLLSYLTNEELIWIGGVRSRKTPYAVILQMNFMLTGKGLKRTSCIQHATIQYIKFLQSIDTERMSCFFDQKRICELRQFHYGSQASSLWKSIATAMRLQDKGSGCCREIVNSPSWHHAQFNHERIKNALGMMTSALHITVIETIPKQLNLEDILGQQERCPNMPVPKIQNAPFTQARYFEMPRRELPGDYPEMANVFTFPTINKYLLEDVKALQSGGDNDNWSLIFPACHGGIEDQDLTYQSPTGNISGHHYGHKEMSLDRYRCSVHLAFKSINHSNSTSSSSPRDSALAHLWAFCMVKSLSTFVTELALAGYILFFCRHPGTFVVHVYGFSEGMEDICKRILEKLFQSLISEATFNLAKEEMKYFVELMLGNSYILHMEIIQKLLFAPMELTVDILGILEDSTLLDLGSDQEAVKCSDINLRGNVPVDLFHELAKAVVEMGFGNLVENDNASSSPEPEAPQPLPDFYTPGETCIRLKNWGNCNFTNSIMNVYILGPTSTEAYEYGCFYAAMKFINHQAFHFLRTKNQLAYSVNASQMWFEHLGPCMIFYVRIVFTAKKHTHCELDQKIDEFLSEFGSNLGNISDDLYEKMKKHASLTVTKQQAAVWFNSKFGNDFRLPDKVSKCKERGIRKISIQEIACGNPDSVSKNCCCCVCKGVHDWVRGKNHKSSLEFAVGDEEHAEYFQTV